MPREKVLTARFYATSSGSFDHFTADQKSTLAEFGALLPVDIPVIEAVGGGSARCILGEVF
ncbi:arginine deiminase-related protein [Desulfonatronovibrio magnus]|uniref:arginine deiminase-related protein n=1 Tax=Desulfonatronovibrio magnus TaxID=698827 RepID=UPI0005EB31CF|nr:arginine deiminase-related protein [Desulfonatronovibrio magnus]